MQKKIYLILVVICLIIPVLSFAAAKRPVSSWSYYFFDGTAFKPGQSADGSAFIAVREKMFPVVLKSIQPNIEQTQLPEGMGVISGICYFQNSGGKLGGVSAFKPYSRAPILISLEGKPLVSVQTDESGYFVAVLAAGTYSVGFEPFTASITVESGVTTLVPLKVGKRMVD